MILYLFFLISVLVFGSYIIGPLTLRVWAVIVMLSYLMFSAFNNTVYKKNKYISLFVVYMVLLLLAMSINGDAEIYGLKWIVANHVVSIIVFVATYYVTKDNRQNRMDVIIMTLIILLVINSLITIAQYFNEPIGWTISFFFLQGRNEGIVSFQESYQSLETLAGLARTPGIFDSSVENGIFLGSFGIIPFYFIKRDSWILKIVSIIAIVLSLIACFMCQERAAMFILSASVLFLGYKSMKNNAWSFLAAISVLIILLYSIDFSSIDAGRFQEVGMENTIRKNIWGAIGPFLSDNLLVGGANQFVRVSGHLPHNIFFNAFVFGGLLGGITVIILFFLFLIKGVRNMLLKKTNISNCAIALAFLSILAQSLVHNSSIVSGDVMTFLLFSLLFVSEEMTGITSNEKIVSKNPFRKKVNKYI